MLDIPRSGDATDIYKRVDQILFSLVKRIVTAAGMPPSIITACTRYLTTMQYYNSFNTTLGQLHKRKSGIPQSCPLAMMIISMRAIRATPRLLTGDLSVLTESQYDEHNIHKGMDVTHEYKTTIGATTAPTKRYNFSTIPKAKLNLCSHIWHHLNCTTLVIVNTRDLRSHLNTTECMVAPTAAARIGQAIKTTRIQ